MNLVHIIELSTGAWKVLRDPAALPDGAEPVLTNVPLGIALTLLAEHAREITESGCDGRCRTCETGHKLLDALRATIAEEVAQRAVDDPDDAYWQTIRAVVA